MQEQRIKIGEGGRIVIPVDCRKALNVKAGDELIVRIEDGELRLFRQTEALKRIQATLKHKLGHIPSITDDFLAFRKQDSGE